MRIESLKPSRADLERLSIKEGDVAIQGMIAWNLDALVQTMAEVAKELKLLRECAERTEGRS